MSTEGSVKYRLVDPSPIKSMPRLETSRPTLIGRTVRFGNRVGLRIAKRE